MNHILIVERDKVLANSLQNFFLSAGYKVSGSGLPIYTIFKRVETHKVDVALIDKTTLGESMKWFIDQLKTYHPKIVINIMTSSPSEEQYELVASEPSVYDVVVKPFEFSEILMIVQRGLEEKKGFKQGKERRIRFRGKNACLPGIEKRCYYRMGCALSMAYSHSSIVEKESKAIDISCNGVRFVVQQPVNFLSTKFVYLKISLPGNELFKSRGKIRWTKKIEGNIRKQIGVQFAMTEDEERNKIARYIYAQSSV